MGTVANVGQLPDRAQPSPPAVLVPDGGESPAVSLLPPHAPAVTEAARPGTATTGPSSPGESTGDTAPRPATSATSAGTAGRRPPWAGPATADSTSNGVSGRVSMRDLWQSFAAGVGDDTYAGGARTAELVEGNRVIMIGDSITESTSSRYGGDACEQLVPRGWAVEIDAATGRFVDYGLGVLDERLDEGFDAAVVMFGNNYRHDPVAFEADMRELIERLAPRPTILFTVTMYEPDRADVNAIIYEIALGYPNVRIIDWETETANHPELLAGDGLHLSDAGKVRFARRVAAELGIGPNGSAGGTCLPTP